MLQTWEEVEPTVITLLKDEVPAGSERPRRYDPEDLISWWNNAQVRLATTRPNRHHVIYTENDLSKSNMQLALPKLFYRPRAVLLPDGNQLERISIEDNFFGAHSTGYMIYEDKLIICGVARASRLLLSYDAYYPKIEGPTSRVHVQEWAIEACQIYVAIQAATREAVAEARYRKFVGRTDAGNPQQIAILPVLKWLEERFYRIVNSHTDDDQGRM